MKHNQFTIASLFLLTSLSIAWTASATHFRYGVLGWEPTGSNGVKFNLTTAFKRSGYGGSASDGKPQTGDIIVEYIGGTGLFFGDSSSSGTLSFRVTAYSVLEDWILCEPANPLAHAYSSTGPYTAAIDSGDRIGALNNRSNGGYRLATTVLPASSNRSPVVGLIPIVRVVESSAATFHVFAVDPDGDPLRWRLSTSAEAGGGNHPPNLSVDANTGVVTWNNVGLNQQYPWTVQIIVEDLDSQGNPKTQSPVDFLLQIAPNTGTAPECHISASGPIFVSVGQPVTFTVSATDADSGAFITLNSGSLPSNATTTPALPISDGSPVSSDFSWTPTVDQIGLRQLLFTATDNNGLQTICSIAVHVGLPPP